MAEINDTVNYVDKMSLGSNEYPIYSQGISFEGGIDPIPGSEVAKNTLTKVNVTTNWTVDGTRYKQTIAVTGVLPTMNLTCYAIPSVTNLTWEQWRAEKKAYDTFSVKGLIEVNQADQIILYSDKLINHTFSIAIMGV